MTSSSAVVTIDLTNSFTLADHCDLANTVIELDTDDSLCIENNSPTDTASIRSESATVKNIKPTLRKIAAENAQKKKRKRKESSSQIKNDVLSPKALDSQKKNKFGGCPICWDELGKNPLASTKCGHVYCIQCIQEYLKIEKRCPTCRQSLKGTASYHPLYLSRE